MKDNDMEELRQENHGFVTVEMVDNILKLNRLEKLLVRTGMGRFVCSVQDVRHYVDMVENSKEDYVRDVSFAYCSLVRAELLMAKRHKQKANSR